jgi:hypothetical protein
VFGVVTLVRVRWWGVFVVFPVFGSVKLAAQAVRYLELAASLRAVLKTYATLNIYERLLTFTRMNHLLGNKMPLLR